MGSNETITFGSESKKKKFFKEEGKKIWRAKNIRQLIS